MGAPMTSQELETIRRRVRRSTPGPWEWEVNNWHEYKALEPQVIYINYVDGFGADIEIDEPDADLIAHARQDLEALLQEVDRLQAWKGRVMSATLTEADEGKHITFIPPPSHIVNFPRSIAGDD